MSPGESLMALGEGVQRAGSHDELAVFGRLGGVERPQ